MTTKPEYDASKDQNMTLLGIHAAMWGILLGPIVAAFLSRYAEAHLGLWTQVLIYIVLGILFCRFMFLRGDKFYRFIKSCADFSWNSWALAGIFILMKKYTDKSTFDWSTLFDIMGIKLTVFILSGIALTATLKASAAAFEILSTLLPILKRRRDGLRPAT